MIEYLTIRNGILYMSVESKELVKNGRIDFKGFWRLGCGEKKELVTRKGDSSVKSKAAIWIK